MKKLFSILLAVHMILLSACGNNSKDFWIIEKHKLSELPEIHRYVQELQTENPEYKGYKVFDTSSGQKIVVISSGGGNRPLRISDFHKSSKDTAITFTKPEGYSDEKNPYIVIGLKEIVGAFYVYEKVLYTGTGD